MRRGLTVMLLTLLLVNGLAGPAAAQSSPGIVLDGDLSDWEGKAALTNDPAAGTKTQDFKALLWSTNINEQLLYFMVQTDAGPNSGLRSRLYFDINNNGSYEDKVDKYAEITLKPQPGRIIEVDVELCQVSGEVINTFGGSWGRSAEDGSREFEFALPMDDLGVYPAQPIRFYLSGVGIDADRLPLQGDNLWAPFPVVVRSRIGTLAFFVVWLLVTLILRRHKIWIFYYIWGAVGFTYVLILFIRGTFIEYQLEQWAGLLLHKTLSYLDVVTYVFDKAPGTLLVLIKVDDSWTTIDIDIESSGLLEMCILVGLIMFYPLHSFLKRVLLSAAGVLAVYTVNIIRLIAVISIIHWGGRNMYFLSHTLVGRLIFFILIIAVYWEFFTKPSLKKAKENTDNA